MKSKRMLYLSAGIVALFLLACMATPHSDGPGLYGKQAITIIRGFLVVSAQVSEITRPLIAIKDTLAEQ
ncbi:MAG: hypothetical protein H6937_01235 [Burkholderiales bacterium]|nr:hypothetical protein [Burkholderiales bacterium]MDR4518234.1 hypothetical protein [Nitrosomonas sp.]